MRLLQLIIELPNLQLHKVQFTYLMKIMEENIMQLEQLQKDMMAAMKARDKERKEAIAAL